jgi:hypothetical protein
MLHAMSRLSPKFALVAVLGLTACTDYAGPAVPFKQGQNLAAARAAVQTCSQYAPRGGNGSVVGSYAAGVVFGGIVLGPIVVASNQKQIRSNGEARAVDRCLAERGFVRRNLTPGEITALRRLNNEQRERFLDHLIGGGSLGSFSV